MTLGFELVEEEVQIFFNFLLLSDKRTTTNHFFSTVVVLPIGFDLWKRRPLMSKILLLSISPYIGQIQSHSTNLHAKVQNRFL
jgi:hypothetical protein